MTGGLTIVTPEKCKHYAGFMKEISRDQADAIFWTWFAFMVVLLIVASTMYTKASRTLFDPEKGPLDTNYHTRIRLKCLLISLVCFILAVVAVIMEAFAAFSIQFCDGEDLMMLYWGFWTLIQVGSLIAIFGIMLNQWYSLREKEHPPWNVALGTPVLVIVALGHAWQSSVKTAWQKWKGKDEKTTMWNIDGVTMHKVPTTPPHPDARHVGYSLTNEPLFTFSPPEVVSTNTSTISKLSQAEPFSGPEIGTGRPKPSSLSRIVKFPGQETIKSSEALAGPSNYLGLREV